MKHTEKPFKWSRTRTGRDITFYKMVDKYILDSSIQFGMKVNESVHSLATTELLQKFTKKMQSRNESKKEIGAFSV